MATQMIKPLEIEFSHLEKFIQRDIETAKMPVTNQEMIKKKITVLDDQKYMRGVNELIDKVKEKFMKIQYEIRKRPTVIFMSEEIYFHFYLFKSLIDEKKTEDDKNFLGMSIFIHCEENDKKVIFGFEQKEFNPFLQFNSFPVILERRKT